MPVGEHSFKSSPVNCYPIAIGSRRATHVVTKHRRNSLYPNHERPEPGVDPEQPNQRPGQRDAPHSGQPAEWPRYGQPRQSPPYGTSQQPYGAPQQPYGTAPQPGYGRVRRPGTLTRAVGAGVVLGSLCLIVGVSTVGSIFTRDNQLSPLVGFIVAAVLLVIAVSCACGVVAAWRGRTSHILFWTSVAVLIIGIVVLILRSPRSWFPLLLCPIWIIAFLLTPSSREFFRARGGTTI
jgi:hypothetical protein